MFHPQMLFLAGDEERNDHTIIAKTCIVSWKNVHCVVKKTCMSPKIRAHSIVDRGRLSHICVSKLNHLWFRWWLVVCLVPSHNLNHCWHVIDWIHGSKFQWNLNQNTIFIQENVFENVVCRYGSHFFQFYQFQCENPLKFHTKYLTHTLKDIIFIQHWNFKSS